MDNALYEILKNLDYIKSNIVKLGPKRRFGENYNKKLTDAKLIYSKFKELLNNSPKITCNETIFLCTTINECYAKILSFEEETLIESENIIEYENMSEKFCLKTATSLLPKMNDSESVTQELIDAIELYSSMLGDDGRQLLINFVIKCRISNGAKLRLSTTYNTVESLVRDMHKHLLTKKSDTAIHQQMLNERQGDRSIKDYGSEIERLFIDLTISQANGDQSAYKTLQPINERNAIRCFANGLRSQRIGTIISARNITELKDAIRVAEDETNSLPNQQVLSYNRSSRPNFWKFSSSRGHSGRARPPQRGHSSGNQQVRGTWRGFATQSASGYRARGGGQRARAADSAFRGRYVRPYRPHYSNFNHYNANYEYNENSDLNKNKEENSDTGNQDLEFFRS